MRALTDKFLSYLTLMAESTHSKTNLERMEEVIAELASNQLHITTKLNELIQRITVLETNQQQSASPSSSSTNPSHIAPSSQLPRMKLEVPRFDGTDPSGWIFKINQFFAYHVTPEHERLTIASFYMEGPALAWFQWKTRNGQLTSWSGLLQALEARFAPSQYEDPTGILFKLTQCGSVMDYLSQFETLVNRIVGLPAPFLLSCFVSGLKPDICREVQALQPLTLVQVVALARLQEEKITEHHRAFRGRTTLGLPPPLGSTSPPPSTIPLLLPPAKPPPLPLNDYRWKKWRIAARRGSASTATRSSLEGTDAPQSSSSSSQTKRPQRMSTTLPKSHFPILKI